MLVTKRIPDKALQYFKQKSLRNCLAYACTGSGLNHNSPDTRPGWLNR